MNFINIGYGNMVSADKILAVVSPDAAPVKRIIAEAKDNGILIDASCGRKTQSVIISVSDHVILSALSLKQISGRVNSEEENDDDRE